jgi:putative aldouronate transport system substrate-binding protein
MKKFFGTILVCVIIGALFAGCARRENQASAASYFKIFARISAMSPDNSEKTLVKQMIKNIPVTIEWNCVSGDPMNPGDPVTQRKNLIFGTGSDYPDAFMGVGLTDYELVTYGSRGVLIPLENYFTPEIMPNLYKILEERPDARGSLYMPDGHIYGLPSIEEMGFEKDGKQYEIGSVRHMNIINKKWLDELGLAMPTTIGELTKVLRAFKAKDPKIIPVGFNNNNNFCGNLKQYYTAFGFTDFNDDHRNYSNGRVSFGALDPRLKNAVKTFHAWSQEGLLDIEGFTQDDSQYISKGKQGLYGVLTWWEIPEITGDYASDYVYLPPLKGDDGAFAFDLSEWGVLKRGDFSVSSACKNPELLLKWIDQLYIPLNSMQKVYGPIGEFYNAKPNEKGIYRMRELKPGETAGELKGRLEVLGPFAQLSDYYTQFWELEPRAQQRLDDIRDFWLPHITNNTAFPAPLSYTENEANTLNKVVDINDFCKEKFAGWVRRGNVDQEWDAHVKQLENMGVNEVVAVWQAAVDRYNAKLK